VGPNQCRGDDPRYDKVLEFTSAQEFADQEKTSRIKRYEEEKKNRPLGRLPAPAARPAEAESTCSRACPDGLVSSFCGPVRLQLCPGRLPLRSWATSGWRHPVRLRPCSGSLGRSLGRHAGACAAASSALDRLIDRPARPSSTSACMAGRSSRHRGRLHLPKIKYQDRLLLLLLHVHGRVWPSST
jgi:hypothetical protein